MGLAMAIQKVVSGVRDVALNLVEDYNADDVEVFLQTECNFAQVEPCPLDQDNGQLIDLEWDASKFEMWLYQDAVYEIRGSYTDKEKKLIILEFADKERQKSERLTAKFSADQIENVKYERTRIAENVRIEVWRRDQGKCASCGSREKLEYDHIVPISRGGSNTARNVELLCETCNRAKGDRIG